MIRKEASQEKLPAPPPTSGGALPMCSAGASKRRTPSALPPGTPPAPSPQKRKWAPLRRERWPISLCAAGITPRNGCSWREERFEYLNPGENGTCPIPQSASLWKGSHDAACTGLCLHRGCAGNLFPRSRHRNGLHSGRRVFPRSINRKSGKKLCASFLIFVSLCYPMLAISNIFAATARAMASYSDHFCRW